MVGMNFIFIFISSSDTNLLLKKSVKQKIKKRWPMAIGSSFIVITVEACVIYTPLTPYFYIVKLGLTGVFIFFLFLL